MSGLIYELIDILNKQGENYEYLHEISLEKREAILENDIKSLQKITMVENIIIGKNQKLEKKRIKINRDIALVLNIEEKKLTISVLAEKMKNQKEYPMLMEVMERIENALKNLKNSNEDNKILLNFSIDYIDFSINILRDSISNAMPSYNFTGTFIKNSNILFDAKQ